MVEELQQGIAEANENELIIHANTRRLRRSFHLLSVDVRALDCENKAVLLRSGAGVDSISSYNSNTLPPLNKISHQSDYCEVLMLIRHLGKVFDRVV